MAVVFYVDPKLAKDSEQDGTQLHHAVLHLLSGAWPEPPVAESAPTLPSPASGGG